MLRGGAESYTGMRKAPEHGAGQQPFQGQSSTMDHDISIIGENIAYVK